MKLNHINLCTSNVPALSSLFEKHFGFILDDPQEVRTQHANLCADGYLPGPVEGMTRGRDCWTLFYHPAGDDLLIEVSAPEPV